MKRIPLEKRVKAKVIMQTVHTNSVAPGSIIATTTAIIMALNFGKVLFFLFAAKEKQHVQITHSVAHLRCVVIGREFKGECRRKEQKKTANDDDDGHTVSKNLRDRGNGK